jgi:hypothetical protein
MATLSCEILSPLSSVTEAVVSNYNVDASILECNLFKTPTKSYVRGERGRFGKRSLNEMMNSENDDFGTSSGCMKFTESVPVSFSSY